jgi:hypothetical protein
MTKKQQSLFSLKPPAPKAASKPAVPVAVVTRTYPAFTPHAGDSCRVWTEDRTKQEKAVIEFVDYPNLYRDHMYPVQVRVNDEYMFRCAFSDIEKEEQNEISEK